MERSGSSLKSVLALLFVSWIAGSLAFTALWASTNDPHYGTLLLEFTPFGVAILLSITLIAGVSRKASLGGSTGSIDAGVLSHYSFGLGRVDVFACLINVAVCLFYSLGIIVFCAMELYLILTKQVDRDRHVHTDPNLSTYGALMFFVNLIFALALFCLATRAGVKAGALQMDVSRESQSE